MTIAVTLEQIARLAPNAIPNYREAFQIGQPVLDRCGITETHLRVIHFMAQILHESGGLTIQFESLNYSVQRLPKVWPTRFQPRGPLDPAQYAHDPEKLANAVYGGRMGNTAPDDGYLYRGRGLLQVTGKQSYAAATAIARRAQMDAPDFVNLPDEVVSAQWSLQVAAGEWTAKDCNALADQDNIRAVTRAINGGLIGLADRIEWSKRTRAVWGDSAEEGLSPIWGL